MFKDESVQPKGCIYEVGLDISCCTTYIFHFSDTDSYL